MSGNYMRPYMDFFEKQKESLEEENSLGGINFPVLFTKKNAVVAARLIPTRRDDKHNICFACAQNNDSLKPNGVFLPFNEVELMEKYGLFVVFIPIKVSKISIVKDSNGNERIYFAPTAGDYRLFFDKMKALYVASIRDLAELKN